MPIEHMAQSEKKEPLYEFPYNPQDYDYHYYLDIPYGYDVESSTYNSAVETTRDFALSISEDSYEGKMERKDSLKLESLNSDLTYTTPAASIRGTPSIKRQESTKSTKSTKSYKSTQGLFKMISIRKLNSSRTPEASRTPETSGGTIVASPTSSISTPEESKEPVEVKKADGPPAPIGPGVPSKEVFPEMDMEKNLVGWTGQDDPAHPRYV